MDENDGLLVVVVVVVPPRVGMILRVPHRR